MSVASDENMASISHFPRQDIISESALNALNTILSQLSENSNALTQSASEIESLITIGQDNFQELSDHLDAVNIATEAETFESSVGDADRLTEGLEQLQTAVGDWESELANTQTTWVETCEQTVEALDALGEDLNQLEESLDQAQQEVQDAASGFEAVIAQCTEQVRSFQSALNTSFEALTTDFTDTYSATLTESFEGLIGQVGETQKMALSQHFTQQFEELSQLYNTFGAETENLGNELKDRCTQLLEDAGHYCTDEVQHELETAMRDAIEEAIAAFALEIAENLVLMGVGSSVTSSLSPVLPVLSWVESCDERKFHVR
jgi:DNA repair exonuclease SbcCD ATPase subunit